MTNDKIDSPVQETVTLLPENFIFTINSAEKELIRVLPDGTVIAPDLESATAAGKLFIESLRIHGKTLFQKINELELEISQLKNNKDEVHQSN